MTEEQQERHAACMKRFEADRALKQKTIVRFEHGGRKVLEAICYRDGKPTSMMWEVRFPYGEAESMARQAAHQLCGIHVNVDSDGDEARLAARGEMEKKFDLLVKQMGSVITFEYMGVTITEYVEHLINGNLFWGWKMGKTGYLTDRCVIASDGQEDRLRGHDLLKSVFLKRCSDYIKERREELGKVHRSVAGVA